MRLLPWADQVLDTIVSWAILLFEYVGVGVIVASGVRGGVLCPARSGNAPCWPKARRWGLNSKLGSEILRTVVVRGFGRSCSLARSFSWRAALTFLIHWEITNEERDRRASARGALSRPRRAIGAACFFRFRWCAKQGERKY